MKVHYTQPQSTPNCCKTTENYFPYGLHKHKTTPLASQTRILFYLHEEVVDASQAVGGPHILLLVPLVHQGALVLDPELPTEVLTRLQHSLGDLRKETKI